MQFYRSDWLSHHGIWAIIPCSPNMVTVRVCSKLKSSWKSVVLVTNKVGKNYRYFVGVFNKTVIIPLALVGYEMIIANSLATIISYPTRTPWIIVKCITLLYTCWEILTRELCRTQISCSQSEERTMVFTREKNDTSNQNRERCFFHVRKMIRPIRSHRGVWVSRQNFRL